MTQNLNILDKAIALLRKLPDQLPNPKFDPLDPMVMTGNGPMMADDVLGMNGLLPRQIPAQGMGCHDLAAHNIAPASITMQYSAASEAEARAIAAVLLHANYEKKIVTGTQTNDMNKLLRDGFKSMGDGKYEITLGISKAGFRSISSNDGFSFVQAKSEMIKLAEGLLDIFFDGSSDNEYAKLSSATGGIIAVIPINPLAHQTISRTRAAILELIGAAHGLETTALITSPVTASKETLVYIKDGEMAAAQRNAAQEVNAFIKQRRRRERTPQDQDANPNAEKARTEAAANGPRVKAQEPVAADISHLKKFIGYTAPASSRESYDLMKEAVETLAKALDTRSNETLTTAQASEMEQQDVAMQRNLATILLSTDNIKRAAYAMGLPKAFGEPTKKEAEALSNNTNADNNRKFFENHPKAQALLLKTAKESPGLLLLIQAALLPTKSEIASAGAEYIKQLKDNARNLDEHKGDMSEVTVLPALKTFFEEHCPNTTQATRSNSPIFGHLAKGDKKTLAGSIRQGQGGLGLSAGQPSWDR